jgi:hypothetical protein
MEVYTSYDDVDDHDTMQACDNTIPPLTQLRLRRFNHPPTVPSTDNVVSGCVEEIKQPTRMDYYRVVWATVALLCVIGVIYVYNNQELIANTTDTLLFNSNDYQGDLLVVSFQLRVKGATEGELPKKADIFIPIDILRSEGKLNVSFHDSVK